VGGYIIIIVQLVSRKEKEEKNFLILSPAFSARKKEVGSVGVNIP
jgi:hypothetical protein